MDPDVATNGHPRRALGLAVVVVLCAASVVRLAGVALDFVPLWIALLAAVFAGLEILSVAWNIIRQEPWSERTFFERISDVLIYMPWP